MDCNRDEAIQAREIAERKFASRDIAGARKFALKAQSIFPELEGISQMIATLDIYLASEVKVNGESDWYAILRVNALADDETVKKQYRKLALQLHPDKNKSVGAEGAFKLISEAWSVLSDKCRKMAYDQKWTVKGSQWKNNGFYDFASNATSKMKPPKSTAASASTTFWTSCNRCKMQYEYLRVYLNHNLVCPNCHEAFMAVETGIPMNGTPSNFSWTAPPQRQPSSKRKSASKNAYESSSGNNQNFKWTPFGGATDPSSAAAQAANMVQETYEKVRREREEAQAATKRVAALRRKNSLGKDTASVHYGDVPAHNVPKKRWSITDDGGTGRGVETRHTTADICFNVYSEAGPASRVYSRVYKLSRENLEFEKRRLLTEKAKSAISSKLEEWNAVAAAKRWEKLKAKPKQKNKYTRKEKLVSDLDGRPWFYKQRSGTNTVKSETTTTIVVPDPEFHDFDKDRSETTFEGGQVWATYDGEDGMPRLYVLVQKVLSLRPFRLRMSFLNSKSNGELGLMSWVASGFAKACGDFRVGRYEVNNTVNIFSHRVSTKKGVRGVIRIMPRSGDTWALYKNWSPDWNELTPADTIHKYEIVEVVDGFDEEQGVAVTPLVKVAGFRAVFHRHHDPKEVRRIPREEMFRFSHQVPSYSLTGKEARNAPKGCRELDPAAVPSEFLQVITEFKEDDC